MAAIDISGLVKTFGHVRALDGLDLTVVDRRGPRVPRTQRRRQVDHHPRPARPAALRRRRRSGCSAATRGVTRSSSTAGSPTCPATSTSGRNLTGGEAIDLLGRLRGGLDPARRAELIERFELDPTKKGRTYSKGNRQKVALVAGLASDAELLLLDEPTSGLDPLKETVFRECIEEAAAGRSHRAALQSHPGRGRGAVRSREHHPRRQDRRDRQPRRAAASDPHGDRRRDRAGAGRARRAGRRAQPPGRRPPRALRRRHGAARRGAAPHQRARRADAHQHARRRWRSCSCATTATRSNDRPRHAAALHAPPRARAHPRLRARARLADRLDGRAERAALPDRRLARRLRRDGRGQPGPDRDGRAAVCGDQRRRRRRRGSGAPSGPSSPR